MYKYLEFITEHIYKDDIHRLLHKNKRLLSILLNRITSSIT